MIAMDVKGTTWVEDILQKIEDMCLEVEEVVCEDTVKYVENQVQTVGASVKKFYSEVMQDFLPPSSIDPVKASTADLSLNQNADFGNYKKPDASIRVCREISDSHEEVCAQIVRTSLVASVEDTGGDSREGKKFCSNAVSSTVSIADASVGIPTSDVNLVVEPRVMEETKVRGTDSTGGPCGFSAESNGGTGTNSGGVSPIESHASGDAQHSESANEENGSSHTGRSGECYSNLSGNNDSVDLGIDTIEQFEHSKLEETCILVDRDELRLNSTAEDKTRSYKKKIRKVFSSRSSARKHEYEQLAVNFENMNTGSSHKVVESAMPTLNGDASTENLPAHDFYESEWELL